MSLQQQMFSAVTSGDRPAVTALLRQDASLASARDEKGVSMLLNARYYRQHEMAAFLAEHTTVRSVFEAAALGEGSALEAAADLAGFSSDGFSPLHLAVFFAREAAADWLIGHGADIEAVARNPMRVRPLHSAAAGGSTACVQALLAAGAEVDARQAGGFTPLMAAAGAGNRAMARALLAAGADSTLANDDGKRAADLARQAGHEPLAREL